MQDPLVGAATCPICGVSVPHRHTPDEIAFRRDQVRHRLQRLIDVLDGPIGFYGAMHSVYGTDYGPSAEKAIRRELSAVLAATEIEHLQSQLTVAAEALSDARSAIATLPVFAFGGVALTDTHTGECTGQYGVRDELLAKIDAALKTVGSMG